MSDDRKVTLSISLLSIHMHKVVRLNPTNQSVTVKILGTQEECVELCQKYYKVQYPTEQFGVLGPLNDRIL